MHRIRESRIADETGAAFFVMPRLGRYDVRQSLASTTSSRALFRLLLAALLCEREALGLSAAGCAFLDVVSTLAVSHKTAPSPACHAEAMRRRIRRQFQAVSLLNDSVAILVLGLKFYRRFRILAFPDRSNPSTTVRVAVVKPLSRRPCSRSSRRASHPSASGSPLPN